MPCLATVACQTDEDGSSFASGGESTATGGTRATGGATGRGGSGETTGGSEARGGGAPTTGGSSSAGRGGGSAGANRGGSAPAAGAPSEGGESPGGAGGGGDTSSGGSEPGETGGAPAGGAPAGGSDNGGSDSGGAFGVGTRCGVEVCDDDEECCGPEECGMCINPLTGPACPETCDPSGGGGAGGASCVEDDFALPDLDRSCATSDDCFLGIHVDCCGTETAVSFARSARAAFVEYEGTCTPSCPCPAGGPRAQDGGQLEDIADAVAECVSGTCLGRAPENAGECLEGEFCIDTGDGGECTAAGGPLEAGRCRTQAGICVDCDCASPDTPIATPTGDRAIATLAPGDLVYSVDGNGIVAVPVARVSKRPVFGHHVVELRLENGSLLRISAGHPTLDGRTLGELLAGDTLDGVSIRSARRVPYEHAFTHDILPASTTGAYFAGGVPIASTLH